MNNAFDLILKYFFPFTSWFLGVYITLFILCFYAHVNESNIIANRADVLITEITHDKSSLVKVSSIQNMVRKTKPSFFDPSTIINSLIGKREPYNLISKLLGNAIENSKAELAGMDLKQVELAGADLSRADMHSVNLKKANLSKANLSGANLVASKLDLVNFQGVSFLNANVYRADFKEANLSDADLRNVVGLTCKQISSAVIDESTHLPDYISLARSSGSTFKCENIRKGDGLDLSGMNLANAYLLSSDLRKFNLSQTNLEKTHLGRSLLNDTNFSHANLKGSLMGDSYLGRANFEGADLRGANLIDARDLTCEQIKSAVIDESTLLPDYISVTGSLESAYKCETL
jgi:uncharacterized protein YjbI with pentapeptide repeats